MEEEWKIDRIDISDVAGAFAKELKTEPKTYFLQGKWGSGKTEYLKEVEKSAEKDLKFIYLELWKPKDKASLAQKIFESIHPKFYLIKVFFYVCAIILPIWASTYISMITITQAKINNARIPLVAIIAILITTIVAYCQTKLFDMNRFMMWLDKANLRLDTYPKFVVDKYCNINGPVRVETKLCPKVLVVDDFDRLDIETQEELYLFFNQIKGKIRIIFVGDWNKIAKNDSGYLNKIIDRQIGLPIQLQSENIAKMVNDKIKEKIEYLDNSNIKSASYKYTRDFDFTDIAELFEKEKKTPRDANKYLNYVENQLISRKKLDKIIINQELYIIYLYLFESEKYDMLLGNYKEIIANPEKGSQNNRIDELIKNILITPQLFEFSGMSFKRFPTIYFIDDIATNHSIEELKEFSKDESKLVKLFNYENSESSQEFGYFLEDNKNEPFLQDYSIMAKAAIESTASSSYRGPNNLLREVLQRRVAQLYDEKSNSDEDEYKYIILQFEKVFNEIQVEQKQKISSGNKLHIFRTLIERSNFEKFTYDSYAQTYFKDLVRSTEEEQNFGQNKFDYEALIYELGFNYNHIGYYKFYRQVFPPINSKVKIIENLNDVNYACFWGIYLEYPIEFASQVKIGDLSQFKKLNFMYKGKEYYKHVYKRCRSVIENGSLEI